MEKGSKLCENAETTGNERKICIKIQGKNVQINLQHTLYFFFGTCEEKFYI